MKFRTRHKSDSKQVIKHIQHQGNLILPYEPFPSTHTWSPEPREETRSRSIWPEPAAAGGSVSSATSTLSHTTGTRPHSRRSALPTELRAESIDSGSRQPPQSRSGERRLSYDAPCNGDQALLSFLIQATPEQSGGYYLYNVPTLLFVESKREYQASSFLPTQDI